MKRVIVEGMDYNKTGTNYVVMESYISQKAGHIRTTWGGLILPLKRMIPANLSRGSLEAVLNTTPIGLFESVQTVLVEHPDGIRVYSCADKERFDFVMKSIFKIAGSFDNAYKQISANPCRFYS